MRFLASTTLLVLVPTLAAAETTETVVHDTTTNVDLALTDQTVLCSSADYGALFLKVLIPQLANLTLLDHQNLGAGAPCVASGVCGPGNLPEDILDPAAPTETVAVRVRATRVDEIDRTAQTCTTSLVEHVDVTIRGIAFQHQRIAPLGERAISDCGLPAIAAPPSIKGDVPDAAPKPTEAGGCSTGGAAGLALPLLGIVAARRRRRPE